MWIDSHCHLTAPALLDNSHAVLARARAAGVQAFIVPAVNFADCQRVLKLCEAETDCFAALGLHPFFAHSAADVVNFAAFLQEHRAHPKLLALGEVGLDATQNSAEAEALLLAQLDLAERLALPVILRARGRVERLGQMLRDRALGGIVHAFNGSLEQAKLWLKKDFLLGFGGVLTFSKARKIRQLASVLPLENLVLESDAPDMRPYFLAPHQPNEPCYVPQFAAILSELRHDPPEKIAVQMRENLRRVLHLPL